MFPYTHLENLRLIIYISLLYIEKVVKLVYIWSSLEISFKKKERIFFF